jgi:aminoglycoside phosphotransferase
MTQVKIIYVNANEVSPGTFVVEAKTANGLWFQHEGPKDFAFFTEQEAKKLEWRVKSAMTIDDKFWISGQGGYYGNEDYEYAILEMEYYERFAA